MDRVKLGANLAMIESTSRARIRPTRFTGIPTFAALACASVVAAAAAGFSSARLTVQIVG